MTVPRYDLYGDPAIWQDNIREGNNGRWAKWKDVEPYVEHCLMMGVSYDTSQVVDASPNINATIDDAEYWESLRPHVHPLYTSLSEFEKAQVIPEEQPVDYPLELEDELDDEVNQ